MTIRILSEEEIYSDAKEIAKTLEKNTDFNQVLAGLIKILDENENKNENDNAGGNPYGEKGIEEIENIIYENLEKKNEELLKTELQTLEFYYKVFEEYKKKPKVLHYHNYYKLNQIFERLVMQIRLYKIRINNLNNKKYNGITGGKYKRKSKRTTAKKNKRKPKRRNTRK